MANVKRREKMITEMSRFFHDTDSTCQLALVRIKLSDTDVERGRSLAFALRDVKKFSLLNQILTPPIKRNYINLLFFVSETGGKKCHCFSILSTLRHLSLSEPP